MKHINRDELLAVLKNNQQNHLDFAIEIENTIGAKNCIFTFKEAFEPDSNKKSSEFMAIFVDSFDYAGETHISANAVGDNFIDDCADKIYREINSCGEQEIKLTLHGSDEVKCLIAQKYNNIKFSDRGTLHSFYCDSNKKIVMPENIKIRMLDEYDEFFCDAFKDDNEDDYLPVIFDYSITNPKYDDCGIIGCFGIGGELLGYLAYYGLDEKIRDISYIYISELCRNNGYGKALLNFFRNKNIDDEKISYYSYPENEYSKKLVKSCGFLPCSHRYEYEIIIVI